MRDLNWLILVSSVMMILAGVISSNWIFFILGFGNLTMYLSQDQEEDQVTRKPRKKIKLAVAK